MPRCGQLESSAAMRHILNDAPIWGSRCAKRVRITPQPSVSARRGLQISTAPSSNLDNITSEPVPISSAETPGKNIHSSYSLCAHSIDRCQIRGSWLVFSCCVGFLVRLSTLVHSTRYSDQRRREGRQCEPNGYMVIMSCCNL